MELQACTLIASEWLVESGVDKKPENCSKMITMQGEGGVPAVAETV